MSNAFRDKITNDLSQASKQKEDLTTVAELVELSERLILTGDNDLIQEAVVQLRDRLRTNTEEIANALTSSPVAGMLVQISQDINNLSLVAIAAEALSSVAATSHDNAEALIALGILPAMNALMKLSSPAILESAVWTLGNLAGDCNEVRDLVVRSGMIPDLIRILKTDTTKLSLRRCATWAMSNLARGRNPLPEVNEVLPTALQLLMSADSDIRVDALWTVCFLSDGPASELLAFPQTVKRILEQIESENLELVVPALRIVGNLLSGEDEVCNLLLSCGCLDHLELLLKHARRGVRKEACWSLSNVCGGSPSQVQQVISRPFTMNALIHTAMQERLDLRKEAQWCLLNAFTGCPQTSKATLLAYDGYLEAVCSALHSQDGRLELHAVKTLKAIAAYGEYQAEASGDDTNPYLAFIYQKGISSDGEISEPLCRKVLNRHVCYGS